MTGTGFSLDLADGALSRHAGLPLAAVCRVGETVYASDGQALYRIGGDTDDGAPIAAVVTLPATDFGEPGLKRLKAIRLTGLVEGEIALAVEGDDGSRREYRAGPTLAEDLQTDLVVPVGRGGRGRWWRISLAGDGAFFDIGAIAALVLPLDRRPS